MKVVSKLIQVNFAAYSTTGVLGDPTFASVELGERLWPEVVKSVAERLVHYARNNDEPS